MGGEVAEASELKWGIWSRDPRVPRFSQRLHPSWNCPPRWDYLLFCCQVVMVGEGRGRGAVCCAAGNEPGSGNNFRRHLLWFYLE